MSLMPVKPIPFRRWESGDPSHMLYHGPELSVMNNHMSTEAANEICYHMANSFRGIKLVKKMGLNAGDFDVQRTLDKRIVVTHWIEPLLDWVGFVDHSGKHKRGSTIRIDQLTYAEITHFASRLNGYRIWDLEAFMDEAAGAGITPYFEWKTGHGSPRLFEDAYAIVRNSGGTAKFMTLPSDAHMSAMFYAGQAGFEAGVLARGTISRLWFTHANIAFWKGSAANGKYANNGAVRLGVGAANATKYGAGNIGSATSARSAKAKITKLGGHVEFYKRAA